MQAPVPQQSTSPQPPGMSSAAPAQEKPSGQRAAIASTLKLVRTSEGGGGEEGGSGGGAPQVVLVLPEAVATRGLAAMTQKLPEEYPPPDLAAKYGLCSYSGLPAKYRDPLTGLRYGSVEAFKELRAKHAGNAAGGES